MGTPFSKLSSEVRLMTATYANSSEVLGGDTLASAVVSVLPDGDVTLSSPIIFTDTSIVTFYASGGTAGNLYVLTCLATTVGSAVIATQLPLQIVNILPGG